MKTKSANNLWCLWKGITNPKKCMKPTKKGAEFCTSHTLGVVWPQN